MATTAKTSGHFAAREMGEIDVSGVEVSERPRLADYVRPYFFISTRCDLEITSASPSVSDILGYAPGALAGIRLTELYCPGCPLNNDESEYRQLDASHGQSVHWLRSLRHQRGIKRIVSIQTVGVPESRNGPVVRLNSIAQDVTESVESFSRLFARFQTLALAEGRLSGQEVQVADRIRNGRMNREIAEELQISERTVDRRRATIMHRLDASSSAEMVARLVERSVMEIYIDSIRHAHWQQARNAHRAFEFAIADPSKT